MRGLVPEDHVVPFRPARHNTVSSVENLLRKSALKRLFFNTPIFRVCLAGAKLYYRMWVAVHAGRHWRRIRAHPVYGPQWRQGWTGVAGSRTERARSPLT